MNRKIKILWISSHAPYSTASDAGGQTFNYYFKHISGDPRFQVLLITLGNEKNDERIREELAGIKSYVITPNVRSIKKIKNIDYKLNPFHKYANLISNYCGDLIVAKARKLKEEGYSPDIIIFEWTNTLVLANQVKGIYPNAKLVASEHDVTFVGYKRKSEYYNGFKGLLWKIKYMWERKIELSALKECSLILPQNWDNRKLLISEGISENKIQWLVPFFKDMRTCKRIPNGRDILFFGAMARPENYLSAIWFIENVMPLLKDMNVRFVVLGSNPNEDLKKYESERVHITGFVNSVIPFFETAVCLVAPLVLGAGIKVKIIEALSSGVPVLTNDIGIEGISAKDGEEYIHCAEPKDYEKTIRRIFADNDFGVQYAEKAKNFITMEYSLSESLFKYKNKLLELGER